MLSNAKKFWIWLVVSSGDPSQVALTVKGFFSLTVVQAIFNILPVFGIHPAFTLDVLGTDAYSAVFSILTVLSSLVTAYGAIIKVWKTITGTNQAMSAYKMAHRV